MKWLLLMLAPASLDALHLPAPFGHAAVCLFAPAFSMMRRAPAASGPGTTQASMAMSSDCAAASSSNNAEAQISTLEFIGLVDAAMRDDPPQQPEPQPRKTTKSEKTQPPPENTSHRLPPDHQPPHHQGLPPANFNQCLPPAFQCLPPFNETQVEVESDDDEALRNERLRDLRHGDPCIRTSPSSSPTRRWWDRRRIETWSPTACNDTNIVDSQEVLPGYPDPVTAAAAAAAAATAASDDLGQPVPAAATSASDALGQRFKHVINNRGGPRPGSKKLQ